MHALDGHGSTRTHGRRIVVATLLALVAGVLAPTAPAAAARPTPGGFTGYAFDARCAPTQAEMDAWLTSSPFLGVGVYIGGSERSCGAGVDDPGQPHLDAAWVRRQTRRGWRLLPIWVGPQASCSSYSDRIDATPARAYRRADAQGRREARAAVAAARSLGIAPRSTLWYDLEGGFEVGDDDCRRSALRFLSGWTEQVRALGFRSGVYSSVSAGIHALDNADKLDPGAYTMPDQIWYAWHNGRANTRIAPRWVRRGSWRGDRVHQYAAPRSATYGGTTLTIDRNFLVVGGGSKAPRHRRTCGVRVDFADYHRLTRGARGTQVRALQCLLRQHRSYRGRLDGRFDRPVVRAVRSYQASRGLRRTGRVDAGTWTTLLSHGRRPVLKQGSSSDAVRRVQRALNVATAADLRVTGVFVRSTTAWVQRYQRAVGVPVTGVVAGDTWAALQHGRR